MGDYAEIGVYILGAAALIILAAAGIATGSDAVLTCAVLAAGAAYVSQLGGALYLQTQQLLWATVNLFAMTVALVVWLIGLVGLAILVL